MSRPPMHGPDERCGDCATDEEIAAAMAGQPHPTIDWKAQCPSEACRNSERDDGRHSWVFYGDDAYVSCACCGEIRDAMTGQVVREGSQP